MDWFKKLVSKEPSASTKTESGSSMEQSPSTSAVATPAPPKPQPPTKEELKKMAEAQRLKEKELFTQLNQAWRQCEDCNPKDRPAKHAALMHMFLTTYDEHRISFKSIKSGFPGLTSGFQTAVCSFIKDGFHNIMSYGTPSQSPKKRRVKDKKAPVTPTVDPSTMQALRLYSFLDKEAYDTMRVLLILSQELVDVYPLVQADMPTTLLNIYQRFWSLPEGTILSPGERLQQTSQPQSAASSSSSTTSSFALATPARPAPEELLISILLQLCSSRTSIVKLMETDALSRLFIIPLMFSETNPSLRDRILPVTSTIIKYHIDSGTIDYLLKRECDCIGRIMEMMVNNFDNFTPSNILDICTMVLTLLEESVKVKPALIEEFNNQQGYNLLTKALLVLEDKAANTDNHVRLIEYIKEFVFVGSGPLYPEHDDENPYNPPPVKHDPSTGKVLDDPYATMTVGDDGTKLRRVRNAEAFQVMQNVFFGSKFDKTKELILDCMVSLFSAHPGNFYALQHLRTVAHFVEALPQESPAVRDGIHQLVLCCATYINVIPFYAIGSLWNVFSEAVPKSKMSVLEGVFNTFVVLLNYDSRYRTILADAGVLQGLVELLQRYHKAVANILLSSSKLAAKVGPVVRRPGALKKSLGSKAGGSEASGLGALKKNTSGSVSLKRYGARGALARLKMERLREQTLVCEALLADANVESLDINAAYPAVTDLLSLMVTESPENAAALKKAKGSQALHNLMQQTETRSGALSILVQLIRHDEQQTEGDMGNLLITLSSHSDIELRRDILLALLDLFKSTPATKRSFREFGGFASVITTIVLLRTRLDTITLQNDPSGYDYFLDTLQLVLSVITTALANHRVNRLHMSAHGGWPLLESTVQETGLWASNPEVYIDWMFQVATENFTYVQTIPSSASTFAKSKLAKDAATLMNDNASLIEAQKRAFKKRTDRYKNAVQNFIEFYTSQNLNAAGELVAEPRDLLSILLSMDTGEHVDYVVDQKSTWMHILPIDDALPIIYNPGPLASLLTMVSNVPIAVPPSDLPKEAEDNDESEKEDPSGSRPTSPAPPKPASVSPQEVTWHLHILLRLTDYARGNVGNLEALSSLGLAGKVLRRWSSHLRNLGSPLHAPLLYIVELIMAYRPDTLEVTQYLGLFEPSRLTIRSLQAILQSFLRTTVCGLPRLAPFFLFDMSRHGYGSMSTTLSEVQWPFSEGYTVSMWCHFDRFSPDDIELFRLAPTSATLLHPPFHHSGDAQSAAQTAPTPSTCIVTAVLRTGQLVLRNAGAEDPLTVETFNFATGRWYHVAIVHERSKFQFSNNGETKVYIDGVVRGSIKANMGAPVNNSNLHLTLGTSEEVLRHRNELPGAHSASASWRLGPFALLDQSLQNVDVLTMFSLGPSYSSSFQGSLGSHISPEVVNSQYLLALEEIRGEIVSETDETKYMFNSNFSVDRVALTINAVKHVIQMHPGSRNLPNFAFLRDPSGKRGIAPLFATTSDAIRGTSTVVSASVAGGLTSGSSASLNVGGGSSSQISLSTTGSDDVGANARQSRTSMNEAVGGGGGHSRTSSRRTNSDFGEEFDEELAEGSTAALANAAGVLAGLGSPLEGGGATAPGGKSSDNATKPPITLQFENGASPIGCWPQPLQTVLYRTTGIDMLLYLFEFVAACEAATVSSTYAAPSSTSTTGASFTSLPANETPEDITLQTPPSSARQSSQLGSATPNTPTLPPDTSMALLVLRCIRSVLRSNPQGYLDFMEKNSYSVISNVMKRFPAQSSEEKMKLFFDIVGVVPNGFTNANSLGAAQEEAMTTFLSSFDSSVLNTLPKPISESLWSLALNHIPSGSLSTSAISNNHAFKNFFLDYRMWRKAPLRLQELSMDYIDHLIQNNLLFHFNVGRMRKVHLLSYLLNVLREESLDMTMFLRVVGLVSDLLVAHHTEKDLLHVAGFLIHTFHLQNNPAPLPAGANAAGVDSPGTNARLEMLATRFDILRNMLIGVVFYLVADAENKSFYEKVFDPEWLNLFITQETNPDTVTIAFKILVQLYVGSSAYSIRVEKTNILKHFAAIFAPFHAHVPLYYYLFGMAFGRPPTELPDTINQLDFTALLEVFKLPSAEDEYPISCKGTLEVIFALIKASSEAYIKLNDANFIPYAVNASVGDSSRGESSDYDSSRPNSRPESTRVSLDSDYGAISEDERGADASAMAKSASASHLASSTASASSTGSYTAAMNSVGGTPGVPRHEVSDLGRRRAISLALPRPNPGTTSSESTDDSNTFSASDDRSSSSAVTTSERASGITGLVKSGIAATGVGSTFLNVFKGNKSSKRKSMVVNSYVPQQVIGGTLSGASVTHRVYPKFQDKFKLYSPAAYYVEHSQFMNSNFAPYRSLMQFIKHVFSRSSAMQDLVRRGDLAHLILSILFPLGRLNIPQSGAVWASPMLSPTAASGSSGLSTPLSASGSGSLSSSLGNLPSLQSGADQWSLLIMEFVSQVLIGQSILNPHGPKDTALLHEVFEVAPPAFQSHGDLLRFNSILLHFLFDQIRPKLTFAMASTAPNTLPKVLAPLSRFCGFAIDRIACCWTQPGTASLMLMFITDIISTLDEELGKGKMGSKDASALRAELHQFTKCLNRLVLHMLHEPLREKIQNQSATQKLDVLEKVIANKRIIFIKSNNEKDFYGTLCKVLHTLLADSDSEVRSMAIAVWKLLLTQKMDQIEFGFVWKNQKGETIDLKHGFEILIRPATDVQTQLNTNAMFTKWFRDQALVVNTIFEEIFGKVARNYWANELKVLDERKSLSKKHVKTREGRTNKSNEIDRISRKRIGEDNERLLQHILKQEIMRFQQSKQGAIDMERYQLRKWSQRKVSLFADLAIWGAVPQDQDTDSPLNPGMAPPPHPLHKYLLDLTEGPTRMRSKTKRNDDFYLDYPYDPTNLQASESGPIIYPTRTPQSTSAKTFAALSLSERILVDRKFYIQRAMRRHQLMAAAQWKSKHATGTGAIAGNPSVGDEAAVDEDDDGTTTSITSAAVLDSASDSGSPDITPRSGNEEEDEENGAFVDEDVDDLDGLDPEQATLERLSRIAKLIPANTRRVAAESDDEEGGNAGEKPTPSSGRRRSTSIAPKASSSKASVSEKPSANASAKPSSKKLHEGESDEDTANDTMSQMDDTDLETIGSSGRKISGATGDENSLNAMVEEEMEAEEEGNQKLKRLLQPGDVPTNVYNCGRVVGLDKMDGIFVICENNAYFIQDYHLTRDHELVEMANPNAKTGSSNLLSTGDDGDTGRKVLRWAHVDVEQVLRRRYLLRPVAIEIFSVDGRNSLLVFNLADRDRVIDVMGVKQQAVANRIAQTTGVASQAKSLKLSIKESTDLWSNGHITNFEYLMRLNTIAGRSYNDLTQYPVFPWIIADYTSEKLDLSSQATYRDLTKPMGALGDERREKLLERYEMLDDEVPKFHYGSHYSSAAIVLHYLIRLEPMTQQFLTLQGGRFDRPDRLFESIGDSWFAASTDNPMDVKELVPEFFYLPEAFYNSNNFVFGRKQTGNEAFIDDVILPPWANGDAHTFVRINRQALESQYVSENLHHWIDLIFGYKQQGPAAEAAMNLFYYLTYEGAVDIDKIVDPIERQGIIDQINNFGQTPTQLFKKPHPKRQTLPKFIPSLFGTVGGYNPSIMQATTSSSSSSAAASAASSAASAASSAAATGARTAAAVSSAVSSALASGISSASAAVANVVGNENSGDGSGNDQKGKESKNADSGSSGTSGASDQSSSNKSRIISSKSTSSSSTSNAGSASGSNQNQSGSNSPEDTSRDSSTAQSNTFARTVIQCTAMNNKGVGQGLAIGQIGTNASDKVVALEMMKIALPGHLNRRIAWGYDDMALRFWDNDKLVLVVPNAYHRSGIVSCVAISADGKYVVTGGTDAVMCVFRLDWEGRRPIFQLASTGAISSRLLGHCAPIAHVTVSRAFSMIVSADTTGQVFIWDLNTFQYTRMLCGPLSRGGISKSGSGINTTAPSRSSAPSRAVYHEHQYSVDGDIRASLAEASVEDGMQNKQSSHTIDLIRIDEANGNIYTSSKGNLCIWDLNGELLAIEEVSVGSTITSFVMTTCPEWMDGVNFLIAGCKDGSIRVYRRDTSPRLESVQMVDGKWPDLPPGRLLLHTQFADKHKAPVTALCLSANQKKLYSGDANGVLLRWEEAKVE